MNSNHILIIEDDPSVRNMLAITFNQGGFTVSQAANGQEGLELAKSGGYSVILTDLKMPNIDGLEFITKLKSLVTPEPNGPIVVHTSMELDYIKEEALRRGAVAFVKKDEIESKQLVQTILALLGK